jgi:hypothetical protein
MLETYPFRAFLCHYHFLKSQTHPTLTKYIKEIYIMVSLDRLLNLFLVNLFGYINVANTLSVQEIMQF